LLIWPELIRIENTLTGQTSKALLIDTEGIGSTQQKDGNDTKVFLLALLLSSYFLYNSVGNIDEGAL